MVASQLVKVFDGGKRKNTDHMCESVDLIDGGSEVCTCFIFDFICLFNL